jgi:hypothetical protein
MGWEPVSRQLLGWQPLVVVGWLWRWQQRVLGGSSWGPRAAAGSGLLRKRILRWGRWGQRLLGQQRLVTERSRKHGLLASRRWCGCATAAARRRGRFIIEDTS